MTGRKAAMIIISLALFFSCVRPSSYECFIKSKDAEAGNYLFQLEMADTLSYDISFYTRYDYGFGRTGGQLGLNVVWRSPSGETQAERVWMPAGGSEGRVQPYRNSVEPDESGTWTIVVQPDNTPRQFRGIGIICKENGTR